jgi:hypothetical protein
MKSPNCENHWAGNNLTLEELAEIEIDAQRSKKPEAKIILRLAAALREAMQVRECACATAEIRHPPNLASKK